MLQPSSILIYQSTLFVKNYVVSTTVARHSRVFMSCCIYFSGHSFSSWIFGSYCDCAVKYWVMLALLTLVFFSSSGQRIWLTAVHFLLRPSKSDPERILLFDTLPVALVSVFPCHARDTRTFGFDDRHYPMVETPSCME